MKTLVFDQMTRVDIYDNGCYPLNLTLEVVFPTPPNQNQVRKNYYGCDAKEMMLVALKNHPAINCVVVHVNDDNVKEQAELVLREHLEKQKP